MAIVSCPKCNKKMSDKAAVCAHCGFVVDSLDAESLERKRRRRKADHIHKLTTHSMLAMLVFVAGIAGIFFYRDEASVDPSWQSQVALVVTVLGFVWYIINRMRMIAARRK
ncbi:zinc ribbon domain-containing protein [Aliidiomarina maris]|uniref:Zinc ribbon protein n=2 Tax=Aliidiomarina maris TaxID=531312 RepID=A0A327WZL1_9GAMM|nr:zinc ribbon domain-containing protein [Aliidiomarina maris]RAJ98951.1 hypothetical protein B0I24_104155 [Aliidiomarina maris]